MFPPRSLFVRIFLWFWLAITLVAVAFLGLTLTAESGPFFALWRRETGDALFLTGRTALFLYEREGEGALRDFVKRAERPPYMRLLFFDDRMAELTGRSSGAAADLALLCLVNRRMELQLRPRTFIVAQPLTGSDGRPFVVVREVSRGVADLMLNGFRALGAKLLLAILVAGGLCYALTRHLTGPLFKLQAAARQLASGDLSVRVGEAAGHRGDEIAHLAQDFDLMAERIEVLLTSQRRLLRDISHELRSPLARLHVALELARKQMDSGAQAMLDRIEREAGRLNNLIGQLLTLERLESGAQELPSEEVDLAALLHEVAEDARFEAQNRGVSVRVAGVVPCTVRGGSELLRSAVENVVRNALRYTKDGTTVEIMHRRLEGSDREGDLAVIETRDHGPGVPEEALGHLFKPFYRVAEDRGRSSGGTGVGLAITDRAVRLHGGSVSARNAPDGGLVVEIRLPVVPYATVSSC